MYKLLLGAHIGAGSIALAAMWVPLIARKGGTLHRRVGWVFVAAMAVVAVSALTLAGWRWMTDPRPQAKAFAVFLTYVGILTGTAVSSGVRALRAKNRTTRHRHPWDLTLPALLTAGSIGMALFGLTRRQPIFAAFALIGLVNGVSNLRYWLRAPTSPMHWWFAHMNGMLGGCIAAVTAFFVVNAGNLGVAPIVAWLSPSLVGTIGTAAWVAYYRRRFSARSTRRGIDRPVPADLLDTRAPI